MGRFDGRTVVVTGAASGIGRAAAARLLDEGATVLGADVADSPEAPPRVTAAASGRSGRST